MAIKLDALLAGVKLPPKQVYIEGLGDTVEFQPIPLSRFKALSDSVNDAHTKALAIEDEAEKAAAMAEVVKQNGQLTLRIIAECLSASEGDGMTVEAAEALCEKVRDNHTPAIFDEISGAIMESIMGGGRHGSGK